MYNMSVLYSMDCSFVTTSQGHLGIHKAKMHPVQVPDHIKSVNIVRLFPDGKSYQCCLCNSIIASFSNFKRHFQDLHKGISLNISAKCVLCDRLFPHCHGAGNGGIILGKIPSTLSLLLLLSYVDLEDPSNNSISAPSSGSCRGRRNISTT